MANNEGWHLDQRVTLAVIFALITQTSAAVWWASGIQHKSDAVLAIHSEQLRQRDQIIRLEEHQKLMDGVFGELKQVLASVRDIVDKIGREQARRTPMVDHVEKGLSTRRYKNIDKYKEQ